MKNFIIAIVLMVNFNLAFAQSGGLTLTCSGKDNRSQQIYISYTTSDVMCSTYETTLSVTLQGKTVGFSHSPLDSDEDCDKTYDSGENYRLGNVSHDGAVGYIAVNLDTAPLQDPTKHAVIGISPMKNSLITVASNSDDSSPPKKSQAKQYTVAPNYEYCDEANSVTTFTGVVNGYVDITPKTGAADHIPLNNLVLDCSIDSNSGMAC